MSRFEAWIVGAAFVLSCAVAHADPRHETPSRRDEGFVVLHQALSDPPLQTRLEVRELRDVPASAGTGDVPASAGEGDAVRVQETTPGHYSLQLPGDVERFLLVVTGERWVRLERTATRQELLDGLPLEVVPRDARSIEGRLIDAAGRPLDHAALAELFGTTRDDRPIPELRAMDRRSSEWSDGEPARIDFGSARFTTPVKPGFEGAMILLEGDHLAAEAPWSDGDGPVDVVVDLADVRARRGSLRVRLDDPDGGGGLRPDVRLVLPFPNVEPDMLPTRTFESSEGGREVSGAGVAPGTYVVTFRRGDALAAQVTLDVPKGTAVERVLHVPPRVHAIVPVELDAPDRAYWTTGLETPVKIRGANGEAWPDAVLTADWRGQQPIVTGDLPRGSWLLVAGLATHPIVVGPEGLQSPDAIRLRRALSIRLRIGPIRVGAPWALPGLRVRVRDANGILVSDDYSCTRVNGRTKDTVIEMYVPPGRSTIEILHAPFRTSLHELELTESPDGPIDLRLE